MHLVEILLPVGDNEGQPFDARKYAVVREELSRRFGGITELHPRSRGRQQPRQGRDGT